MVNCRPNVEPQHQLRSLLDGKGWHVDLADCETRLGKAMRYGVRDAATKSRSTISERKCAVTARQQTYH
jgi:hypothetical protein